MELILSTILLLVACAIVWVWRRRRRISARPDEQHWQDLELPNIGEPGSVTPGDLKVLRQSGVNLFDPGQISSEQARLVVDCVHYVDAIWQAEFQSYGAEVPSALRTTALRAILHHQSYRDYVVMLEARLDRTVPGELPRDGCYRHVYGLLAEGVTN